MLRLREETSREFWIDWTEGVNLLSIDMGVDVVAREEMEGFHFIPSNV
jgi:hypothetical protein